MRRTKFPELRRYCDYATAECCMAKVAPRCAENRKRGHTAYLEPHIEGSALNVRSRTYEDSTMGQIHLFLLILAVGIMRGQRGVGGKCRLRLGRSQSRRG